MSVNDIIQHENKAK